MKEELKELEQKEKYLTLLKIDATNIANRIEDRHREFMEDFSLKRDRKIFEGIFFSRYDSMQMSELSYLTVEIIELANTFYKNVDELRWYLKQTQDMPQTIEEEILRHISKINRSLENLNLYIGVELQGIEKKEKPEIHRDRAIEN